MSNLKSNINHRILALALTTALGSGYLPASLAADGELNFKVYSPDKASSTSDAPIVEDGRIKTLDEATQEKPSSAVVAPTLTPEASSQSTPAASPDKSTPTLTDEAPVNDTSATAAPPEKKQQDTAATPTQGEPVVDNQPSSGDTTNATAPAEKGSDQADNTQTSEKTEKSEKTETVESTETSPTAEQTDASKGDDDKAKTAEDSSAAGADKGKVLKGYVQVVPSGTKIPIIMDTAVDSDTSQEGDEFSARTAEDLTIDGTTAVPAGSIIRGRIATINAPKHLDRSGSVALKFDTVTTPDNRQIPLVANLVARGGVVHARRGMKDIAIQTGIAALPTLAGIGIGAVAGNSGNSKLGMGGGALIGAGVGVAVGVAILLAKKGKKVDVRPGDELKIELAEDLHMPTM